MINRELAERAFYGTSFSPEKRADQAIRDYNAQLEAMRELIFKHAGDEADAEFERFETRFTALYTNWLSVRSRCVSTMIAGPSNFPVRQAQKANDSESKRWQEVSEYVEKVERAIMRKYTDNGIISSDDPQALDKLRNKLAKMEAEREEMKAVNAAWRKYDKKGDSGPLEKLGFDAGNIQKLAAEVEKAYSWEKQPYPKWMLSNLGQNIKRVKDRITQLERQSNRTNGETEFGSVRMVENADENRIQLFFPGKPDADIRSMLKSHGFRWSPRNGCWQCYFNNHGIYQTAQVLKAIGTEA